MFRSAIQSARQHNWFSSAAEFLLLIVGIFLGFQADRWNNDRLEQVQADEYAMQLLDDLTASREEMQFRIDYFDTVKEWGLKAATAWEADTPYSAEELIIALYQASNDIPSSTFRGAYDALTRQGLAVLINGPEFASTLSAYFSQPLDRFLEVDSPYREEIRGIIPFGVQETIREQCAVRTSNGRIMETLLGECQIGMDPSQASALLEEILSTQGLQERLTYSISNNSIFEYVLEVKILDTEGLIGTLEEIYN